MITRETKVAIKAVAQACALVADSTVGTCGRFPVFAIRWERIFSRNRACDISVGVFRVNSEKRLTARLASGFRNHLQQRLLASVVSVSEGDSDFWFCFGCLFHINLNLGNCKVGKGFQSILNRVGVIGCTHSVRIDQDWTGVVLSTKLVSETQLEKPFLHTSIKIAHKFLDIVAAIIFTVGLGIITFWALAKRTIITFVPSIAVALLVLQPWPVNTPGSSTGGPGVRRNIRSIWYFGSLTEVVKRVSISATLSMSTAVVGARGSAASFASKRWEAFAFTGGAVTETTSTTLAVCVLVVKSCIFGALQLLANCRLNPITWVHRIDQSSS